MFFNAIAWSLYKLYFPRLQFLCKSSTIDRVRMPEGHWPISIGPINNERKYGNGMPSKCTVHLYYSPYLFDIELS